MSLKRGRTTNGKCQAKTKAGRQCAAPPVRGKNYCSLHADPARAAELGRKGGARNRKVYDGEPENIAVPESAADVRRMLAEAMAETRAKKMDPKLGSTIAYIATALLRAYDAVPPPQANASKGPLIYGELRFRSSSSAAITEATQQKELQAPNPAPAPALPAPTTEAEIASGHERK